MAARQTAKYGVAAAIVALAIIAGVLVTNPSAPSTLSSFTSGSQSFQLSSTSTGSQGGGPGPSTTSSSAGGASSQSGGASTMTTTQSASTSSQGGALPMLNIYMTDAPPASRTLKYLLVNVSSVELDYAAMVQTTTTTSSTSVSFSSSSSTTTFSTSSPPTTTLTTSTGGRFVYQVPASTGVNVNLTSLQGKSVLLGATSPPEGNVTMVTINITGAKAFYTDGSSEQLRVVANGKLMVPIRFSIQANGSTDLTLDITPNSVHISGGGGVLTPVIHATAVGKLQGATTTDTGSVDLSTTETTATTTSTTTSSSKPA